jgi:preprotein translocase subunit SecB
MTNSPLLLENHFLTKVELHATRAENVAKEFDITCRPFVSRQEGEALRWNVVLRVEIKSQKNAAPAAYEGKIEFFGTFSVDPAFPEERRDQLVRVNGSSILYGAVRELVANLTARGPYPMVRLPSISFAAMISASKTGSKNPRPDRLAEE